MSNRYDVGQWKDTKTGKKFFVRLGTAVDRKEGGGMNVYLDALPLFNDGACSFSIMPQRERGESAGSQPERKRRDDLDDEVPF